jgi:hypothetical protein
LAQKDDGRQGDLPAKGAIRRPACRRIIPTDRERSKSWRAKTSERCESLTTDLKNAEADSVDQEAVQDDNLATSRRQQENGDATAIVRPDRG